MRRHRVVVLALDGVMPFELAIAGRVFGSAQDSAGQPLYSVATCTLDGRPVRTEADFAIAVEHDATLISSLAASEVPVREREPRRVDRLLDVRGAVGADDRHVHARAGQRPGDRELADDVAPLAREALELLHLLEVAAPHVALE